MPLFDLDDVHEICRHRSRITCTPRAIDQCARELGFVGSSRISKAKRAIVAGIKQLDDELFCENYPPNSPSCDVYALLNYQGLNWYVKFYVSGGRLVIVSFHPPERDMFGRNGQLLCPGECF